VDAAAHLVHEQKRTDIHFACVGGGTELENIKSYAREKQVSDYFTFTGRVSDQILFEVLNTADHLC
jgi:glycosyltransferase involved in cell wall biosynthesis